MSHTRPYEIFWLVENRVIVIRYQGFMDRVAIQSYLDETFAMRDQANKANGENGPLVHTITDARGMTGSKMTIQDAQRVVQQLRKQRAGWSIYIARNNFDRFTASVGHQFMRINYRIVMKGKDATAFLQRVDPTLPALPVLPYETTHV